MTVGKNPIRLLAIPDSTNLESIGYDADLFELYIVFSSSPEALYIYEEVPHQAFAMLVGARSIGSVFHEVIVRAATPYKFVKVENYETDSKLRLLRKRAEFDIVDRSSV